MSEFANCACYGTNLERLIHPAILTLLVNEELHGYVIVQRLQETPMLRGNKPDPSGVYRFLKAMEQDGFVTACWDLSNSGPAKRQYKITDEGIRCLQTWVTTLTDYNHSLTVFLALASSELESRQKDK